MSTAVEYLEGLEKEAVFGMKALGGVANFMKKAPKPPTQTLGGQIGARFKTAKKWSNEQYGKYKKTDMGKKYGDNPLYAAGGLAAGGIIL